MSAVATEWSHNNKCLPIRSAGPFVIHDISSPSHHELINYTSLLVASNAQT